MIVYANCLPILPSNGFAAPIEPLAEWLSRKVRRRIHPDALLRGGEIHKRDGWQISAVSALGEYPQLISIELIHPDAKVSGRRWHSEIGLRHRRATDDIEITALVHTSEISARVTAPVDPGAPTFVAEILSRCPLSSSALGADRRTLGDDDAEAFRYVLLDPSREYPLVVVSPLSDGTYLVDVELLSQLLIGIAEVVVIPPSADTFWLARSVGRDFIPYLGAAKIIYPPRSSGRANVRTLTQEDFAEANLDARRAARELFSLVLHRTNVRMSWRHVSAATVRHEIARRELERRKSEAARTGNLSEYIQLLEEVLKDQEDIARQALAEKQQLEDALESQQRAAEDSQRELQVKNEALKLQLEHAGTSADESPYAPDDTLEVADAVANAIRRDPTPEECLKLAEHLFSDRITILPDAWTSARDAEGFRHGRKLYDLLHRLGTAYWSDLVSGKPDQEARRVFGSAYAAKESEGVSTNKGAKRMRTFRFAGDDHFMDNHLKIGVKDSAAETIRVHFKWFADRKRIVIGHCGPHIPFK